MIRRLLFAYCRAVLITIGMMVSLPGCAQTDSAKGWQPVLDRELAAVANSSTHPLASLSVLAIRRGDVVYQRQFGYRYIDDKQPVNNRPADRETLYRIASVSKLVTTLGVMRLVEAGKLQLDSDVSEVLGFKFRNPAHPDREITLRMLLDHTSSLRDDGGYYWEAKLGVHLREVFTPGGKHYGQGAMWDPRHPPGDYFHYCNLAWGVIGTLMERVNGERFDRLMRRLVLDPLGLKGGFHPADFAPEELRNVATLYRKRSTVDGREVWNASGPWVPQVDDYVTERAVPRAGSDYQPGSNGTLFGPQGNCRLSADGLGRIMLMLLNRGRLDGKPFLAESSVATMLRESWRFRADAGLVGTARANGNRDFGGQRGLFNAWGLGNQRFLDVTGDRRGDRLVAGGGFRGNGHLGDAWGLTAAFVFDPDTGNGMIFLTGGPGFDPGNYPGQYSALTRHEELILDALYRRAILEQSR